MANFLFTHWEGGGNTPPMLAVVRRLVRAGDQVRVLSDACNREEAEASGASFTAWSRGYQRVDKSLESDMLRDWEAASPPAMIARMCERLLIGPALHYALDTLDELRAFPADVVVTSEMLLGVMAAAEKAAVPCVALSANIYFFPLPGVPPFGPGLVPAKGLFGRMRDAFIGAVSRRAFGKGTDGFNAARRALGLGPVRHPFDQLDRVTRHLLLTSSAFDFPSSALPERIVYAGPELEDPAWAGAWTSPWSSSDLRPLVLVGFSTTFQNQSAHLQRVVDALSGMDVRAVVTVGPMLDAAAFHAAPNVHVCAFAPHAELLREAAVMITHCGHGTVIRSLAAGVPLVCMPMGRDQDDNAARVVARGAGVRLRPSAGSSAVRGSIQEVLSTARYRENARSLGNRIREDGRRSTAVSILQRVAGQPCAAAQ